MFSLVGSYLPPPEGVASPPAWGDPSVVRQRLGDAVTDIHFDRGILLNPGLSVPHMRQLLESTAGPLVKLTKVLQSEPERQARFRKEFEALLAQYFEDNALRQHYLLTRATKR
jgi:hypothetical protein